MTVVRGVEARRVAPLTDRHLAEFARLVAADPIGNAVVASRLAAFGSLDPARLGGVALGARREDGALGGAVFHGGNLLPVGGVPADWEALAGHLAARPRLCTSIVGDAAAVGVLWPVLERSWGRARAVREDQPLLVLRRGEPIPVRPDERLRVMRPGDLERYLPAAVAMFTEELGVSPFAGRSGSGYRRRIESLLATGRSFGIVDEQGRVAFKADLGALTAETCQLQGVWVRPDLRGHGLGTAAMAAVLHRALALAPAASLYVNSFNAAARRMYARVGMRRVGTLATVLFAP